MRSRRLCLWGLLLALPLSLWISAGDNLLTFIKKNREQIFGAPAGAAYEFAGSTWLLERVETLQTDSAGPTPPSTVRVLIRISVTPHDAATAERLRACEVWLGSSDGRRWSPDDNGFSAPRTLPRSCHGTFRATPKAGQPFRFELLFIVPAAVASEVEPLIGLPEAKFGAPPPPLLRLRRH